jgi:hypothetical protein
MKIVVAIAMSFVVLQAPAQRSPSDPIGRADSNQPGPWDNDVLIYRVAPGGQTEKLATFERAGVPTLARLSDGRLISAFQHFPSDDNRNFDRVAVRFSRDEGKAWTPAVPIVVEKMDAGLARPFDPALVPLPDGRVRLYFTSNRNADFRRSTPAIYSSISTNGIDYVFEPGVRFAIEGRIVIDCAATLHQGVFHLFVPDNGSANEFFVGQQRREPHRPGAGYHATSKDGLNFVRADDVTVSGNHRWLGNAQSDGSKIIFFGTSEHRPGELNQPRGGIWTATSTDGIGWSELRFFDVPGADPGAVATRDGGWLLAVTGPPRPGTATARRRDGFEP